MSSIQKVKRISSKLASLIQRIREVYDTIATQIALISSPVFSICANALRQEGFRVLNNQMIDFPGSGRQREFRNKLSATLRRIGESPSALF